MANTLFHRLSYNKLISKYGYFFSYKSKNIRIHHKCYNIKIIECHIYQTNLIPDLCSMLRLKNRMVIIEINSVTPTLS